MNEAKQIKCIRAAPNYSISAGKVYPVSEIDDEYWYIIGDNGRKVPIRFSDKNPSRSTNEWFEKHFIEIDQQQNLMDAYDRAMRIL